MKFTNPSNGYSVRATTPFTWLWCLLFGFFYFAYKGIWRHAIIGFLVAILTLGFSWLAYPFFASWIVRSHYRERGWLEAPKRGA